MQMVRTMNDEIIQLISNAKAIDEKVAVFNIDLEQHPDDVVTIATNTLNMLKQLKTECSPLEYESLLESIVFGLSWGSHMKSVENNIVYKMLCSSGYLSKKKH